MPIFESIRYHSSVSQNIGQTGLLVNEKQKQKGAEITVRFFLKAICSLKVRGSEINPV